MDPNLYGPNRFSAQTHVAKLLARDSVLQRGEWHDASVRPHQWDTTFGAFFKGSQTETPRVVVGRKEHGNTTLHKSHFILGSDQNPKLATTASDFDKKLMAPERVFPDKGTSIPDFAPKYMSDRTFGQTGSVYVNSFGDGLKKGNTSSAKNKTDRKQYTQELRATHFQFGNDNNVFQSETRDSFKQTGSDGNDDDSVNAASQKAKETYKSCVFRQGDWNETGRSSLGDSVTRKDFHIKPFTSSESTETAPSSSRFITREELKTLLRQFRPSIREDEIDAIISECNPGRCGDKIDYSDISRSLTDDPSHPFYQRSTHFLFGSNTTEPNTLYHKDFVLGKKHRLPKPMAAAPPMSSKVLPILQEPPQPQTTNKSDFVDHSQGYRQMAQVRDMESKYNQQRHTTQAVVLTCDVKQSAGDRQASMTGYDYLPPPKDFPVLSPRHEPRSRYRYLDSDGTLLQPPVGRYCSEAKEGFIGILGGFDTKAKHTECVKRIQDQQSSHFRLGSDVEPKLTEQTLQFNGRPPLDPKLRAAGKSEGPEQKYSHVYPSESADRGALRVSEQLKDKRKELQEQLQQLNQEKNALPRDPVNINLRKAFLEYDTSLSGKISLQDLQAACKKLGVDTESAAFENLYNKCDKDANGYIDYYEFAKNLTKESELGRGPKPHVVSVMKADFCPPELRRISSGQQRLINASKKVSPVSVSSHYFHLHRSLGAPRLTTTAQDFARPDRMPGTQRRLSAR